MPAVAMTLKRTEPLRAYILTLREARGLSQEEVAKGVGIHPRTYTSWENGQTKELKLDTARSLIRLLGGWFEHLEHIDEISAEEARALAVEWLNLTPAEQEAARTSVGKLKRIVALTCDDPDQLVEVVNRLRKDAQANPAILDLVLGYLDGVSTRSRP